MNRYRNLWHKQTNIPGPEFYTNDGRKIAEHRGVTVYKVMDRHYDYVFEGACITQRAGASKPTEVIDDILDGQECVSDTVYDFLATVGVKARRYGVAT